jgi:hypothetical protein
MKIRYRLRNGKYLFLSDTAFCGQSKSVLDFSVALTGYAALLQPAPASL